MRIRQTLFTTVLLLLLATPCSAFAQDTRYRVEVIVFTHLGHAETPREVASVSDYGDALDFLTPAEPLAGEDETAPETAADLPPDDATIVADDATVVADDEPAATAADDAAPAVVHIEELGDVMQDAWRRLRLSGPFRPLLSLAWEQGSTPPFPLLRVHDQNIVMTQDPWALIRPRLEAGEPVDAWIEAGLGPPIPPAPPPSEAAPLSGTATPLSGEPAADPAADLLEHLPPPRLFYALDGTVSLVRSRFLHLYIDLQQREGVYEPAPQQPVLMPRGMRVLPPAAPPAAPTTDADNDMDAVEVEPIPTAFRVFDMMQNRQVKTGQVEYFDGPVLSVLAYVTAIEPEAAGD